MKAELYNRNKESVGNVEIPESLFGAAWRPDLVKQVLTSLTANRRRPWAHAKGRGEVRGGGKKPWRQKGTGRSRHGSIRSPLWPGGGTSHGPVKERDYSQKINKKMRQGALRSALSKKFTDHEVMFFDTLGMESPKTNELFKMLAKILNLSKRAKKLDVVIIPDPKNAGVFRASRNLMKAKAVAPSSLNIEDILSHKQIFIEAGALPIMEKHYASAK